MQNLFNGIYNNKTVFVTGHTGFKGAWLSLWLKALGARVVGYSLSPPTQPSLFEVLNLSNDVTHITGDICDHDKLLSAIQSHQPEIVFHCAAQSLVRLSYQAPRRTFETNVMGTVNVLESVRTTPSIRIVVNITSDKCYENREWEYAYRENDPMGGFDPYSSSKGCAELVASAYRNSFFNPSKYDEHGTSLVSVRSGNVIGGGDWAVDRIIPDCIRSIINNNAILLRNPNAIRPWQHVLEPLSGYLWLGALLWQNPLNYDYGWNFGPNLLENATVYEIVSRFIDFWGEGEIKSESSENKKNHPHEANFLKLDCTKASTLLRWKPVFSLDDSLKATMNWYLNFYKDSHFNARRFTHLQIREYVNKAKESKLLWAVDS